MSVDQELLANDIMRIVTRNWEPQGKVPVANYNRIFAEVYTLLLRAAQPVGTAKPESEKESEL